MDIALLLVLTALGLYGLSYTLTDGDLLSPPAIMALSFAASAGAAAYNAWNWEVQLSGQTFWVILIGMLSFAVPAFLAWRHDKDREPSKAAAASPGAFRPSRIVTVAVHLYGVVISYLYVKEIYTQANNGGGWTETLRRLRWYASYGDHELVTLPTWLNYGFRFFMAFAYVYLFIAIRNRVAAKRFDLVYLLPMAIYSVASLAQGSRGQILNVFFAAVIIYWVCLKRYAPTKGPTLKVAVRGAALVVAIFAAFGVVGQLIGRETVKTPFDSLMTYLGGSIIGLDQYLRESAFAAGSDLWGRETFRGVYQYLGGFLDEPSFIYTFQLEFRFVNGVNVGNLYTAFRYYFNDFGYAGLIVLPAILGVLFMAFYQLVLRTTSVLNSFYSVAFGYLSYSVAALPLSDYFFCQYLSPTVVLTMILFYLATRIVGIDRQPASEGLANSEIEEAVVSRRVGAGTGESHG